MTTLREAAQQALEALEEYQSKGAPFWSCDAAVAALRAALAEPVEPVQEQAEPIITPKIKADKDTQEQAKQNHPRLIFEWDGQQWRHNGAAMDHGEWSLTLAERGGFIVMPAQGRAEPMLWPIE